MDGLEFLSLIPAATIPVAFFDPRAKPIGLQGQLMAAVSDEGDLVIDPTAGSFSVLEAAREKHRTFLGCDLNG